MFIQQTDIMERLKESTRELHQAAEQHPFQQAMIHGSISCSDYVDYLSQMLIVHGSLEAHLRRRTSLPPFQHVIRPHHFREHLLLEDLQTLSGNVDSIKTRRTTRQFIFDLDESAQESEVSLLGFLYVLEGSTNGSKFIAKSVQRALGFQGERGTSYLNPHRERQRDRWAAFKKDMSAIEWSEPETNALVGAAESMFRGLILVSDELSALECNEVALA